MSGMARAVERPTGTVLLERSEHLALLAEQLKAVVATSRGRMVLLGGEAGVGKTALVRRFADDQRLTARTLFGACDPLFTPRPLGPLLDIAQVTGGHFEQVVLSGLRPHEVTAGSWRLIASLFSFQQYIGLSCPWRFSTGRIRRWRPATPREARADRGGRARGPACRGRTVRTRSRS